MGVHRCGYCCVYIPPDASTKEALGEIYESVSKLHTAQPGFLIITGDFNQANLYLVLPKFHYNIKFATRGKNSLDQAFTNIPKVYKG